MICDFITEAVGAERRDAIAEDEGLAEATREVDRPREGGRRAPRRRRAGGHPDDDVRARRGRPRPDDPEGRVWRRQLEFMLEGMREPSYSEK